MPDPYREPPQLPDRERLLHPHDFVFDFVLTWADAIANLEMGKASVVSVLPEGETEMVWAVTMKVRNHLGEEILHGVQVFFDGEAIGGDQPRYLLRKLAPTAWKLSPNVLHPRLHAFVTIIGVPDPAPWE